MMRSKMAACVMAGVALIGCRTGGAGGSGVAGAESGGDGNLPAALTSLVRIDSAPECAEFDPYVVDGCRYEATVLRHDTGSTKVVFFINDDGASWLKQGDLLPVELKKIDKEGYPTEYFGTPAATKSLVRIVSDDGCAEYDPFVVDGCKFTAKVLHGAEAGKQVVFFINNESESWLKAGDLVDVELKKIGQEGYPTEFFGVAVAEKTLVRIAEGPECAEFDPYHVDGCRYAAKAVAGEHAVSDVVFFINNDAAGYLKAGDLLGVQLKKVGQPDYPKEYFATH